MNPGMIEVDKRNHQKMLAERLIQYLGLDGAAHACRENCWHGVLDFIPLRQELTRGGYAI